jgi:hypothetical protein
VPGFTSLLSFDSDASIRATPALPCATGDPPLLKAFLVAFCVCFLLGSWHGWDEKRRSSEEDFLLDTAIGHMQVSGFLNRIQHPDQKGDRGDKATIQYVCNNATYFTYNLHSGDQKEETHPETKSSLVSAESLEKVFEGATGVHLFELSRGALAATTEGVTQAYKARKIIATVAGAISGYYLGRLLTARRPVPCDSPVLVAKLRDASSDFSLRVRREFFRRRIEGLQLLVDGKSYRLVDVQDRIAPPGEIIPLIGPGRKYLFPQLSALRQVFARTNYKPTSNEYVLAWLVTDSAALRLRDDPSFFAPQFPGAKKFEAAYDGPFDPNDTVASFKHTSLFTWPFIRFILILCVLAAAFFLSALGLQAYLEHKKPKQTVLLP